MSDILKTFEVNYDVSYSPNPLVINTKITSENNTIKVKIDDVPNLSVTLTPKVSGNPVNDILTAVGSLGNLFQEEISKKIVSEAKGISADIYTISDISIDPEGIQLKLSPSNVTIENDNGLLMVSGDIDISGS
ncbi:hypothetical protein [Moorena producens]|uniref:hypothetical protein n=1 Tax=Moorena producens TaxID=1155739 RepID=UPI003C744B34